MGNIDTFRITRKNKLYDFEIEFLEKTFGSFFLDTKGNEFEIYKGDEIDFGTGYFGFWIQSSEKKRKNDCEWIIDTLLNNLPNSKISRLDIYKHVYDDYLCENAFKIVRAGRSEKITYEKTLGCVVKGRKYLVRFYRKDIEIISQNKGKGLDFKDIKKTLRIEAQFNGSSAIDVYNSFKTQEQKLIKRYWKRIVEKRFPKYRIRKRKGLEEILIEKWDYSELIKECIDRLPKKNINRVLDRVNSIYGKDLPYKQEEIEIDEVVSWDYMTN